ncbi:MAG: hypothetical protein D6705_06970 [Deltaproteobacteria bacterium]|nr:MAG: hypothetical protein D6705_06970 [Deltaproteobacteria bacterium]
MRRTSTRFAALLTVVLTPATLRGEPSPPLARFEVVAPPTVRAGTIFEVSLTPAEPVARDLPLRVDWLETTNATPPTGRVGWREVADPHAARPRIVATMKAGDAAGPATMEGQGRYHTCRGDLCVLHVGRVHVETFVTPSATR